MTIIDQLKYISKHKQDGDITTISEISGLNKGLISNYIKNGHRMIIKKVYAEKIVDTYFKFKQLKEINSE
jgi:hypothetical protein